MHRSEVRGLGASGNGEMSTGSLSSDSHGGIDDHISQLMQCKPLSEQQVRISEALRILIPAPLFSDAGGVAFQSGDVGLALWEVGWIRVRGRIEALTPL